jgi:hypothetical protein
VESRQGRGALAAVILALALPVAATAQVSSGEQIAADPTAANLTAHGGALAWSREAEDGYRLVVWQGGVARDAPVESFSHPVQPDLGTAADGSLQVVYARCPTTRRCDLHRLPLASGSAEIPLVYLNEPDRSEYSPSVWRGRVAFGRAARIGVDVFTPYRRGGLFHSRHDRLTKRYPFETDLWGPAVAFVHGDGFNSSVRVQRTDWPGRGQSCVLDHAFDGSSGGGTRVRSVSLSGGWAYWLLDRYPPAFGGGSTSTTLVRRKVPRRHCRSAGPVHTATSTPGDLRDVAVTGGRVFYLDSTGVRRLDGQGWSAALP